ncbi:MAG: galactose oxidase-like domain-containing protein [Frankia sp.]
MTFWGTFCGQIARRTMGSVARTAAAWTRTGMPAPGRVVAVTHHGQARSGPSRRNVLRVGGLAAVVAAVNGPLVGGYALGQYRTWRHHQVSYERVCGRWDVVGNSHTNSVHGTMLNTGQVLMVAGSGNNQQYFDEKVFRSVLLNSARASFTQVYTPWDAFCCGHTVLPDGRVLFAGGTKKYEVLAPDAPDQKQHDYQGLKDSFVFDPAKGDFSRVGSMNHARWYPTLVTTGDGTVVAVSGLDEKGYIDNGNTESFDPVGNRWIDHPGLHKVFPTYPALLLVADGRLFFTSANAGYGPASVAARRSGLWNLRTNDFQDVVGLPQPELNETAASLLLPPAQDQKVMFLGGGANGDSQVSTARTAIVDLSRAKPKWQRGPDMNVKKRYPGAVILPDDTVLVTNGSTRYRADDSRTSEIYDPADNSFRPAADPYIGRDYHAQYLLLPDGRVVAIGSNPLRDNNYFETGVSVYSPPYLFQGPRPSIVAAPTKVARGRTLTFTASGPVAKVRLMRPGSYTHVTDTEQRSIALPIVRQPGETVTVTIPENPNLVPTNWYMLFVVDGAGRPSTAAWVHVQ